MTTKENLEHTAEVVYGLMTGVYDLDVFRSPYNRCVPNDLTDEHGAAYGAFAALYSARDSALDLLNTLENTADREEIPVFEAILDASDHALAEYSKAAFVSGYRLADKSGCYNAILGAIAAGEERFVTAGDAQSLGAAELDKMQAAIDKMLELLAGKAFAYGIAAARGAGER